MEDIAEIVIMLVAVASTDRAHKVTINTRILEDAGIDSLGLMDIVEKAQHNTGIRLEPEDYVVENFDTVESIVRLFRSRATGD